MTLKLSMYLVVFLWLYFALIAAFPYFISGELSFLNAYFEAMSGLTTTGYSMFPDTSVIPYTINFWRGFTQWFGGLGIIFMVLDTELCGQQAFGINKVSFFLSYIHRDTSLWSICTGFNGIFIFYCPFLSFFR